MDALRTGLSTAGNRPDVFTFHAARELLPPDLAAAIVHESRTARLPGIRQHGNHPGRWRYLLPYMPHYFSHLDLSEYRLIISSSHACAHHVRAPASAAHVAYVHTPMRYAWVPDAERGRTNAVAGVALRAFSRRFRKLDLDAARRPDAYVANSTAVQERIRRFWGRASVVVHPPVDVGDFDPLQEKEPGRFLWVHRLVAYKQPELVAEAFRGLPYQLTMIGIGPLEQRVRAVLPPNVELLPWLSREELVRRYTAASGFIHVAEEDFGITMVEALAAGSPVVALDAGGARDIVRSGIDGLRISRATVEELRQALREVASRQWNAVALAARAQLFSRERFATRMLDVIQETLSRRSHRRPRCGETLANKPT